MEGWDDMKTTNAVKGYYFVSVSDGNNDKVSGVMIKTNAMFTVMDVLNFQSEDQKQIEKIKQWLSDIQEYRVITQFHEDFLRFVQYVEQYVKVVTKDAVRILKSRYWNMRSEVLYKLKCPTDVTNKQLLTLYGITSQKHTDSYYTEALELLALANAYTFDKKTTRDLIQKGISNVRLKQLETMSLEQLMKQVLLKEISLAIDPIEQGNVQVKAKFPGGNSTDSKQMEESIERGSLHEVLVKIVHKSF
jgi:hypothetical protein